MRLLIDGYNLLHQSNLMGAGRGAMWLERARGRLIRALVDNLDSASLPLTTIVFDRHSKKQIDAEQRDSSGVQILFAVDYPEADDLIEHLIARHPQPRQLTVVSSDHRLQNAASRRGAKFCDSDTWFDRLTSGHFAMSRTTNEASNEKPDAELTDRELAQWMSRFGIDGEIEQQLMKESSTESRANDQMKPETSEDFRKHELEADGFNPFPDGYGEDLLDD